MPWRMIYTIRCLNPDDKELLYPVDHSLTYKGASKIAQSYRDKWNMGANIYLFGMLIETRRYDNVTIKWGRSSQKSRKQKR